MLGEASLGSELPIDPGTHVVRVSASGREPREYRVELREGDHITIDVEPGSPLTRSHAPAESNGASSDGASAQASAGYALGAVGVAGLVVAAVAGVLVFDAKDTVDEQCDAAKRCTPEGLDAAESGETFGVVTTIGLAVGAFGLGVGSYLVLSATPAADERGASARMLLGGRF